MTREYHTIWQVLTQHADSQVFLAHVWGDISKANERAERLRASGMTVVVV